jgi:hypothetical protein
MHEHDPGVFLVSVVDVEKDPDAHPVSPKPCIPPPSSMSMGGMVPFELCPDCYPKPGFWKRLWNALKSLVTRDNGQ